MKKLPRMHDKIKVSARMIVKEFGKCSGVTLALLGIMSKRWRSAWLILHANPSFLPFWFSVQRVYWKAPKNLPPLYSRTTKKTFSMLLTMMKKFIG